MNEQDMMNEQDTRDDDFDQADDWVTDLMDDAIEGACWEADHFPEGWMEID